MSTQQEKFTAIANAIRTKKGTSDNIVANDFASEISSIDTSGADDSVVEVGEGALRVRFIDPIKGLFRIYYVDKGDSIDIDDIYPLTHDRLTFQSWVYTTETLDNIQGNIDVGVIYTTTSGKMEIDYTVTEYGGSTPTLQLVSDDADITVEWGDGQTTTGLSELQPENPIAEGSYTMLISCPNTITATTSNTNYLMGNAAYNNYITAVRLNGVVLNELGSNMLYKCYSLKYCTIPNGVTNIGSESLAYCGYKAIIFPNGCGVGAGAGTCSYCNALTYAIFPQGTYFGVYLVSNNPSLSLIVAKPNTYRIYGALGSCTNLLVFDISTIPSVPPLQSTTASIPDNELLKILVPSALLTDFQEATNWSYYADKMIGV